MPEEVEKVLADAAPEEVQQEASARIESFSLAGTKVCSGVAFGYAQQLGEGELEVPHF